MVVFAILAIIVLVIAKPFSKKQPKFTTAEVKRQDISQTVSASGTMEAVNKVTLQFLNPGKLSFVNVKVGDSVRANQTIAGLDSRDLIEKRKIALLDYNSIRWDFEQTKENYKDTILNDTIKRTLEKSQFDLDRSVANVNLPQISLENATLTTPIAGIVTQADTTTPGENVPATNHFTIIDPNKMKFVANIDEGDIGIIKTGQAVTLTLDAYSDKTFSGQVDKISFSSVLTNGGGTAFPVEILYSTNPDLMFKDGMNGDIEVVIKEAKNTLVVPSSAITTQGDKKFVQVLSHGENSTVEVKTGVESDTSTEITQGLSEGQTVIVK